MLPNKMYSLESAIWATSCGACKKRFLTVDSQRRYCETCDNIGVKKALTPRSWMLPLYRVLVFFAAFVADMLAVTYLMAQSYWEGIALRIAVFFLIVLLLLSFHTMKEK